MRERLCVFLCEPNLQFDEMVSGNYPNVNINKVFLWGIASRTVMCTHCFQRRITIPVTISSLIHFEMNFWNGKDALLWALAILGHKTES